MVVHEFLTDDLCGSLFFTLLEGDPVDAGPLPRDV